MSGGGRRARLVRGRAGTVRGSATATHGDRDRHLGLGLSKPSVNLMRAAIGGCVGVALLASCASSGTEPNAMTAGQHEAAAKSEEQAAKEHPAQYDPSQAVLPTINCPFSAGLNCYRAWTSVESPTERHLAEGKRHAELAAQHRAASQALRDAETRSCKNVPEGDQDVSPFYHREDIVSVATLKANVPYGGPIIGAEVVFASLPGMTAEWLQRVVDCHLARNAVLNDAEKMASYCPLAVPHVKAAVRSVGSGFAVDVTSNDEKSVREIISRAEALKNRAP